MGVWDLIKGITGGNARSGPVAKGMPPAGVRVPGAGDGKTSTNRKVKLDKPKRQGKHRR
jgi:hypothetical protein